MKMKSITAKGSRIEQLKELAKVLAAAIDACINPKALPAMRSSTGKRYGRSKK